MRELLTDIVPILIIRNKFGDIASAVDSDDVCLNLLFQAWFLDDRVTTGRWDVQRALSLIDGDLPSVFSSTCQIITFLAKMIPDVFMPPLSYVLCPIWTFWELPLVISLCKLHCWQVR